MDDPSYLPPGQSEQDSSPDRFPAPDTPHTRERSVQCTTLGWVVSPLLSGQCRVGVQSQSVMQTDVRGRQLGQKAQKISV